MVVNRYHVQPRSQKDETLPYTYEAWVDILEGRGLSPVYDHYFSDTLCGLVECLAANGIAPDHVQLLGLYGGEPAHLDKAVCLDAGGDWLSRPALCHALEEHYAHTHEECYRGHVEKGHCLFEDRDREPAGPTW